MSTKSQLQKFNEIDLWSIMLFALYKIYLFSFTILSSNGPLKTSNVFALNSVSSSKNNTPKCAKLISYAI